MVDTRCARRSRSSSVKSEDRIRRSIAAVLWELFKQAGWAPFVVVLFHRIVLVSGLREYRVCDWILHFSGGVTIAYFLFHLILNLELKIGKLSPAARLLLTYTSAVTIAAFWELAEFAASFSKGTVLQHSLSETMIDLFNGVLGAAVTIIGLIILRAGGKADPGNDPRPKLSKSPSLAAVDKVIA
jgi:hypothetical protein